VLADFRWHSLSKSSAHAQKQKAEHNSVVPKYCPALQAMRSPTRKRFTLTGLRVAAAGL